MQQLVKSWTDAARTEIRDTGIHVNTASCKAKSDELQELLSH